MAKRYIYSLSANKHTVLSQILEVQIQLCHLLTAWFHVYSLAYLCLYSFIYKLKIYIPHVFVMVTCKELEKPELRSSIYFNHIKSFSLLNPLIIRSSNERPVIKHAIP